MGHAHGSRNCPDCSSMKPRSGGDSSDRTNHRPDDRLSVTGFEHVYSDKGRREKECADSEALAVVTISDTPTELLKAPLQALARAVEEQGTVLSDHISKLEGASYRIGYLEAMLSAREEQLKLLPDLRAAAARAITNERRCQELQEMNQQLERELAELKGAWWCRFGRWLLGQ